MKTWNKQIPFPKTRRFHDFELIGKRTTPNCLRNKAYRTFGRLAGGVVKSVHPRVVHSSQLRKPRAWLGEDALPKISNNLCGTAASNGVHRARVRPVVVRTAG